MKLVNKANNEKNAFKLIKRTYKWIIFSILLQTMLLTYLDSVFSGEKDVNFVVTDILTNKLNNSIYIPKSASNIKLSFDGSYVSYIWNENLEIMKLSDKEVVKVIESDGNKIDFYRWLPDRNMIIYAMKLENKSSYSIEISTYDMESKLDKKYPKLTRSITSESEVCDIDLSPLTNVVYVKIKINSSIAAIYRFNVMAQLYFIINTSVDSVMEETMYTDSMIYQDGSGKIHVRDGVKETTKTLPFIGKNVLLGIDSEDRIYVGETKNDNEISKIYYGKCDGSFKQSFMELNFNNSVMQKDLIISQDGKVFAKNYNGNNANSVYNLVSDEKINFKGDFVGIFNNCIVSKDDDKLIITKINK